MKVIKLVVLLFLFGLARLEASGGIFIFKSNASRADSSAIAGYYKSVSKTGATTRVVTDTGKAFSASRTQPLIVLPKVDPYQYGEVSTLHLQRYKDTYNKYAAAYNKYEKVRPLLKGQMQVLGEVVKNLQAGKGYFEGQWRSSSDIVKLKTQAKELEFSKKKAKALAYRKSMELENGRRFREVIVTEKLYDSIAIEHATGVAKVKYDQLPKDLRDLLGEFEVEPVVARQQLLEKIEQNKLSSDDVTVKRENREMPEGARWIQSVPVYYSKTSGERVTGTVSKDMVVKGRLYSSVKTKVLDGLIIDRITYDSRGRKESETSYKDGFEHGETVVYKASGDVDYKLGIRYGMMHGMYTDYHIPEMAESLGQKIQGHGMSHRGEYRDGVRVGLHEEWTTEGKLESRMNYAKLGADDPKWVEVHGDDWSKIPVATNSRGELDMGLKHGMCEEWSDEGRFKLKQGEYNKGVPVGLHTRWDRVSHRKLIEASYNSEGKMDGVWKTWGDDGYLVSLEHYEAGNKTGISLQWFEAGGKGLKVTDINQMFSTLPDKVEPSNSENWCSQFDDTWAELASCEDAYKRLAGGWNYYQKEFPVIAENDALSVYKTLSEPTREYISEAASYYEKDILSHHSDPRLAYWIALQCEMKHKKYHGFFRDRGQEKLYAFWFKFFGMDGSGEAIETKLKDLKRAKPNS